MIVKVHKHPSRPNLVVIQAGPEMATTMGRYRQARHEGGGAYYLEGEQLETVVRDLTRLGHTVLDDRTAGEEGPSLGPLPECRACGQPVPRATQPPACPACGSAPLRLVSFENIPPKDWANHLQRAKGQRPAPPRAAP